MQNLQSIEFPCTKKECEFLSFWMSIVLIKKIRQHKQIK
jgi:hypothetical protein